MKKIYSLAFALVALLAITSCKNEIDDVFDHRQSVLAPNYKKQKKYSHRLKMAGA